MSARGGIDALLDALPRWALVGGKGGVGKTTCAAALALRSAERGDRTLLLSTDPARSLGAAIGESLGPEPRPVAARPGLHAMQLDAGAAREAFLARWRDVLVTIVDRGTYLDADDIAGMVDAALPGADETMALLALAAIEAEPAWRRVVVDTAPTGHTLRLLALPDAFRALVALLDLMQDKHRFMVSALMHRYRRDAADAFLAEMRRQVDTLTTMLGDRGRTAMVLVTRPEAVVAAETARYAEALAGLGLGVAALVVNAVPPDAPAEPAATTALDAEPDATLHAEPGAEPDAKLDAALAGVPRYEVPRLAEPPIGVEKIEGWGRAVRALGAPPIRAREAPPERHDTADPALGHHHSSAVVIDPARPDEALAGPASETAATLLLPLTIVGGKGGVGKTTTACALGVIAAAPESPTLVVSTDPAPSVADALGQPVGEREVAVAGAPGLFAQQLDASAAFERLRREYRDRVDGVFEGLMGPGMDAPHDRRILRDLLAFAPPGVDEVYALASLGETLAESRYAAIVVDPAPTGHLLRLLEMPAVALDWSHRLLRLMLKYKELTNLGDSAAELLAFAKRTKAVDALLRDHARAGVLVVALDEPLVRGETERLVGAVRDRGLRVLGVVWNRAAGAEPRSLAVEPPVRELVAPARAVPPVGVEALRAWAGEWRALGPGRGS